MATLAVGIAFAAGLSLMIWDAANANGLIVDEFAVPPDLAVRGRSGKVVAAQLLSDLLSLQARSNSVRAASSYANNWGNNLKVEIPETGVSIGELSRFLREWLGHETHVSGAVVRTGAGVEVRASAESDAFPPVSGAEADLDGLVQKMAEAIYASTQPYRYALHFYNGAQYDAALSSLNALAANGSVEDRFWAYSGLTSLYATENNWDGVEKAARNALALRPGSPVPNFFWARTALFAQYEESALVAAQAVIAGGRDPDISKQNWATMRLATECVAANLQGDFQKSTELCGRTQQSPGIVSVQLVSLTIRMLNAAAMHDAAAVRAALAAIPPPQTQNIANRIAAFEQWSELALGHLPANESLKVLNGVIDGNSFGASDNMTGIFIHSRTMQPLTAHALALSGDLAGARAMIERTPIDCSLCLRMRGQIATMENIGAGADYWFGRAVQNAPSTPFANESWGRSYLARGKPDDAIAQFTLANRKGPHFADPLEGWGEALMAKNLSHRALAKFAEAEKYAPNWGRLHLKWGEALAYANKKGEAKKQFARAAELDLTPAEKAELARKP
ncbi:MAG TPA: hypothetical protein VG798_03570 [Rhizomicrobium sp.]|nr:hypothetical protein [Rhizomicrobium sp.]